MLERERPTALALRHSQARACTATLTASLASGWSALLLAFSHAMRMPTRTRWCTSCENAAHEQQKSFSEGTTEHAKSLRLRVFTKGTRGCRRMYWETDLLQSVERRT